MATRTRHSGTNPTLVQGQLICPSLRFCCDYQSSLHMATQKPAAGLPKPQWALLPLAVGPSSMTTAGMAFVRYNP